MTAKESLVNKIVGELEADLNSEQLRKVNMLLMMYLEPFELVKSSTDIVIYDEKSDASAYHQFMVSKKIQGLSDGTLKLYMQTINFFMSKLRKPFKDITTNDIRLFIANREIHDRISKGTLARERGCIVRFFHWLYIEEFIDRDPGARVEKIKVPKRRKQEFSELEVEKLRSAASNAKETLIIELLLSTGCRVAEVVSLNFSDYDQENDSIEVIGKGNKQRTLYFNAKAKLALNHYLKEVPHITGPLFYGQTIGKEMTTAGIQKLVKRLGERAGVLNVHPHRFRRTAATLARRHGMPIELVSRFLGHENIETTMAYSMINDDEVKISHQKFVS
ncbi:tyrosine-type recombinase/integrase [Enterococcus casseliflavus]|uniref:tyrosine-type recombinase/integrase n=1 Tax=Enterococcus innesii TaxID=2839759 RepID=UPI0020902230|nr:tyrosine-type recombinase/integrase [Enterococcus innesii]MCO5497679.1 tyrosine-type recombinase/integrase [Enterococcus innesii]MEC5315672.1 tyrosine-type recombinase/integrase [Enterococcus casseliflavus]